MRLPIGAETYTVTFKKKVVCDGEEVLGCCRYDQHAIEIDATLAEGPMYLTLWHEIMHAVFHENGYERDADSEAKVEAISHDIALIVLALTPPRKRAKKR